MFKVQNQLEEMKKRTNECEFIIKKDERVRKLEAQISWFREEALYLSSNIQELKKENVLIKEKSLCLEEDKQYLQELQMKEQKKNKLLQSAMQQTQANCEKLMEVVKQQNINFENQQRAVEKEQFYLTSIEGKDGDGVDEYAAQTIDLPWSKRSNMNRSSVRRSELDRRNNTSCLREFSKN